MRISNVRANSREIDGFPRHRHQQLQLQPHKISLSLDTPHCLNMKYLVTAFTTLVVAARGFMPLAKTSVRPSLRMGDVFDQEQFIAESKEMRLKHLEEQAMFALKIAVENYGKF